RMVSERLDNRGDCLDRDAMVERWLPLAHKIARRYAGRGQPYDDLLQVACLGLVRAIDRFDRGRGAAFSTYAVPTIVGEVKRYNRDSTWVVRVPRSLQELALNVESAGDRLAGELGRTPTVGELPSAVDATDE
ncbi:MAG: sigma-70 family RNA polymerase sigma factor, partial [Solirubrobacteraceae bacterium]